MARREKMHDDTQELVTCKQRSDDIKRFFIIIGSCCILLVITLGTLLIVIGTDSYSGSNTAFSEQRQKREAKLSRSEYMNLMQMERSDKCNVLKENMKKEKYVRSKRQISLDPIDHHVADNEDENTRKKRKLEEEIASLNEQYKRCKEEKPTNGNCDIFYNNIFLLVKAMTELINKVESDDVHNKKLDMIDENLMHSDDKPKVTLAKSSADVETAATSQSESVSVLKKNGAKIHIENGIDDESTIGSPSISKHSEKFKSQSTKENVSKQSAVPEKCNKTFDDQVKNNKSQNGDNLQMKIASLTPVPRIVEDVMDENPNDLTNFDRIQTVVDIVRNKQQHQFKPNLSVKPVLQAFRDKNENDKNITPLKNQNFDPSTQILQLCDQIGRQNINSEPPPQVINKIPSPTSSGFITNNVPNFQPNFPQQQQQQQPQPQFNVPQFSYRSNPICFYPSPVQQFPVAPNMIVPQQHFMNQAMVAHGPGGFVIVPSNAIATSNAQQFGTTSPSGQGFVQTINQPSFPIPHARNHMAAVDQQPYYCAYAPVQVHQMAAGNSFPTPKNSVQDADIIYASYANQLLALNSSNSNNRCVSGETSCFGTNECIPNEKWCDSVVDCLDSSDEIACSCTSRLSSDKICDGYSDCPMGSDEIGCFGCDKFAYSCYNNAEEYENAKHSSISMCYSALERCDGFENCLNGKDERECSIIVKNVGPHTTFMVPHIEGILHRNFKGNWYPVCNEPSKWAREACEAELGTLDSEPIIKYRNGNNLPGPFISKVAKRTLADIDDQIRFSDTCQPIDETKKLFVYVECPKPKCGSVKRQEPIATMQLRIRNEDFDRKKRDDILRVVGGFQSDPQSWPYIVAVYKDGHFNCGGTIHTAIWIITAAHCVTLAENHYYEVQAGLLRRFSHAAEVQIVKVSNVIVNKDYSREDMANDLALMKLEKPLTFNRWVRPICLPSPERVTVAGDRNWRQGPAPGTVCTAVGWGAMQEREQDPADNLREVNVPIIDRCKHSEDIDGNEICAGEKDGGRDACQGDSGGPLFCRSQLNPSEFYLAGIVSHGAGCARPDEPGVYTRVALYIEWIFEMEKSDLKVTSKVPQILCPGFRCVWTGHCLAESKQCDGFVDCLSGEDELQCTKKMDSNEIFLGKEQTTTATNAAPTTKKTTLVENSVAENATKHGVVPDALKKLTPTNMLNLEQSNTTLPIENSKSDLIEPITTILPDKNSENAPTTTKTDVLPNESAPAIAPEQSSTLLPKENSKSDLIEATTTISPINNAEITTKANVLPAPNEPTPAINEQTSTTFRIETITTTLPDTNPVTNFPSENQNAVVTSPKPSISENSFADKTKADNTPFTTASSVTTESSIVSPPPTHSSIDDNDANRKGKDLPNDNKMNETITAASNIHLDQTTPAINISNLVPHPIPSDNKTIESSTEHHIQIENVTAIAPNHSAHIDDKPKIDFTEPQPIHTIDQSKIIHPDDDSKKSETIPHIEPTTVVVPDLINELDQKNKGIKLKNSTKIEVRPSANGGQNLHELIQNLNTFICRNISQTINVDLRCDGTRDCEDGTDEESCTCRDSLRNKYSHLICNGQVDCIDLTDEKDCLTCSKEEYECRLSKKCIPKQSRCDENFDCNLKEDELDCVALGDGKTVLIDVDLRPSLNHKGIVCKNINGVWNVMCVKKLEIKRNAETAGQICSILGFSGYSLHNVTTVTHTGIMESAREAEPNQSKQPFFSKHLDKDYFQSRYLAKRNKEPSEFLLDTHDDMKDGVHFAEMVGTPSGRCFGLYVECVPHSMIPIVVPVPDVIKPPKKTHKPIISIRPVVQPDKVPAIIVPFNTTIEHKDVVNEFVSDQHWPWSASIYINGNLSCNGILLSSLWVLVEGSCVNRISWERDVINVVLGRSKSLINIKGPFEQIIRVDCMRALNSGNGMLLHLFAPAQFNRYSLPTYLPQIFNNNDSKDLDCLAVSHSKLGGLMDLALMRSQMGCLSEHECFRSKANVRHFECGGYDAVKYGVVVCKSESSSYYPVSLFMQNDGLCSFNNLLQLLSLEPVYPSIQNIIGWPYCDYSSHEAHCAGHRCSLGKCISSDRLCDGKIDCHDGSDEVDSLCSKIRACPITDIHCKNKNCVPKAKFCDHINDCGDRTDEPQNCTCLEYLKATDPSSICDGVPNCSDKSDESACPCNAKSFRCGQSEFCVPQYFVCDKQADCPNGEDEQLCYGLEQPSDYNDGYSRLIERSSGEWQTKCFKKPQKPTKEELATICNSLGFKQVDGILSRPLNSAISFRDVNDASSQSKYRNAPVKIVPSNGLSILNFNDKLNFTFIKHSHESVRIKYWDHTDHEDCYELEINCDAQ